MMRITTVSFLALLLFSGCEPRQAQFDEAMEKQLRISKLRHKVLDGTRRADVPYLRDFLTLYPNGVVRYLSFGDSDFPGLSVTTTLHDRYKFNLRVPVRYSDDNLKIVGYGEPKCHLVEIGSVTPRDDGVGGTVLGGTNGGDLQKHFGIREWEALVSSKGNFSVLAYELKTDKPVPNFDLVIQHLKSLERRNSNQAEHQR